MTVMTDVITVSLYSTMCNKHSCLSADEKNFWKIMSRQFL